MLDKRPCSITVLLLTLVCALLAGGRFSTGEAIGETAFPVRASPDGRYLVDAQNQPFFYHADTAWNLPKKLTLKEAEEYFDDRKAKGFTATHMQAVSKEQGPPANRDGHNPFDPLDEILRPNEPYWRHLDRLLEAARRRGLLVALAALWIRWGGDDPHGWRHQLTKGNAQAYGRFLGGRYKRFDNIVWILGGDANPGEKTEALRRLAAGLRETAPHHLLTVHAAPDHASARWFGDDAWLDINMVYTYREVHLHVQPEYNRTPGRPIVLGESGYEEESNDRRGGDPWRMRRQAYRAILSGAQGGHAFGQKHIWRFDEQWRQALDSPASQQMAHVKALFAVRPWYGLAPDERYETLVGGKGTTDTERAVAARANDGRLVIVYVPTSRTITIDMSRLSSPAIVQWFDPTDGACKRIGGSPFANTGARDFTPPKHNAAGDHDFLLVLAAAQ